MKVKDLIIGALEELNLEREILVKTSDGKLIELEFELVDPSSPGNSNYFIKGYEIKKPII